MPDEPPRQPGGGARRRSAYDGAMKLVTPKEMNAILAAVDAIGIHREAVIVQLDFCPGGKVGLFAGKKVDITAPDDRPLEEWLKELPDLVRALDLSKVKRV